MQRVHISPSLLLNMRVSMLFYRSLNFKYYNTDHCWNSPPVNVSLKYFLRMFNYFEIRLLIWKYIHIHRQEACDSIYLFNITLCAGALVICAKIELWRHILFTSGFGRGYENGLLINQISCYKRQMKQILWKWNVFQTSHIITNNQNFTWLKCYFKCKYVPDILSSLSPINKCFYILIL